MNEKNYERILKKVSEISGNSKEEIERKVEAKRAKLSGLISKEGAIQIIAVELGLSLDEEKLKINELLDGMRKVNVSGSVISISPIRSFVTRDGDVGKVVNLMIADETSNVKVVLWDTHHIELIENKEVNIGDSIEIYNASMRGNELHLGSFSEFKKTQEKFENLVTSIQVKEKEISELRIGDNAQIRGFIVQIFEPKFFNVCPTCKKKLSYENNSYFCAEHGKVVPEKRALINLVLDDGTETIRAVLFNDSISKLGIKNLDELSDFSDKRKELLGKEMFFSGVVRNNKFTNKPELIINDIKDIELDELIKKLESKENVV